MKLKDLFESIELDLDKAYEIFKSSYEKATGSSWSKEKFMARSRNWKFYGDERGFVSVRPQRSGMMKLNGVAGNTKSILKGLKELLAEGHPTWGMVSKDMLAMAHKIGFITPPAFVLKILINMIPSSVLGAPYDMNDDGSITLHYSDVGSSTKYFIGNKQYFKALIPQMTGMATNIAARSAINALQMLIK